jgi:hypothetical protein
LHRKAIPKQTADRSPQRAAIMKVMPKVRCINGNSNAKLPSIRAATNLAAGIAAYLPPD